ncbi:hypothetical protein OHS33_35350 [Streptomyces sp. NBC_00536]|uniref:hypothetical protein n=1 Tax=Streptomyces sp. NBC_00536 TaxID=2975769 RepID=UPI002E80940A|nr:hypothetical protein [Streptomyces sp. NBC_00536]WUC83187.1 hypothetical protein OHS33_35350 [Streptomyces sp. NBC_00536]
MASRHRSTGFTEAQLSIIDELGVLPFPEQEGRPGTGGGWGGPGYHVAVLRQSQDFWDDRSDEIVEAAEKELEADLDALVAVLTARWGAPTTVDLWPYLGFDHPDPEFTAPEPLGFLCNVAGRMQVWRPPSSGRWLALAIGQADRELPFELLAAMGEASSLPG